MRTSGPSICRRRATPIHHRNETMIDRDEIKADMCEMGRRIYQREMAAAHDGNITVKISENEFLCTPTLTCKGFLKPQEIATIDASGNQIAGPKQRSSEALLHLQIYRARPDVRSVVHCHPPHATAFGIAREPLPQCVLPEVEMYLGEVPITPYRTPGTESFAETILPFVEQTNAIILANHGTVTYGENVEQAYWRTEILESYCRMLILAKQIGGISYLSPEHSRELLDLKSQWGFDDARNTPAYAEADIRNHCVFRKTWPASGVRPRGFAPPPPSQRWTDAEAKTEAGSRKEKWNKDEINQLVDLISSEVIRKLNDTRP